MVCPHHLPPPRGQKDDGMTKKVEYRVRSVTKYIVTRYEESGNADGLAVCAGSTQHGTFENGETAYHVARALCRQEHVASGEPVGSMNFIYPNIPDGVSIMQSR